MKRTFVFALLIAGLAAMMATPAAADNFFFSTGDPDGKIATASRPGSPGKFEIESADDFVVRNLATITGASFTGLLPSGTPLNNIGQVVVEIYRVFPADSNTIRTPNVPTRVNSPSDDALASRNSGPAGGLSFTAAIIQASFTATNSVQPGGIHLNGGGNGPFTGEEVTFNVNFTTPFNLPPDHYFFVPQVAVNGGDFLWLSAPKPIVAPGTPFPLGFNDLQSWTRDANLDPDWLRVGTDIVGGSPAPQFNAVFSLSGTQVPLPGALPLLGTGLAGLLLWRRWK